MPVLVLFCSKECLSKKGLHRNMKKEDFNLTLAKECAQAFAGATDLGCIVSDKNGNQLADYGYSCAGCRICRLANQVSSHTQLQSITHPYLQRLSEQFEEVLCVSVERDMTMVYVDVASGPEQTLMSLQRVGNTSPMHCTGNGKLLLLNYTPEQLDEMIRRKGLPRYTQNTITTREGLVLELERIRREGLAYDNEECEVGVRCLACPIYDHTGKVMAGMSVTGPISRMTDEKVQRIRGRLSEAAKKISEVFGYSS